MTFRKCLCSFYGFSYFVKVDFIPKFNTFDYLNVFHPACYHIGTEGSFTGVNQPGRETDLSSQPNAEVKNGGAILPLSHMSSWHVA
jgi:hypothetical protein